MILGASVATRGADHDPYASGAKRLYPRSDLINPAQKFPPNTTHETEPVAPSSYEGMG